MAESAEHPMVANWPANVGAAPSLDGERVLWGVVVLVMLLDVATTAFGIQRGLQEGNGLVRSAVSAYGISGLVGIKVAVLALAGVLASQVPDRMSPVVPLGLLLPTLIAVAVNLALLGML